MRGGLLGLAAVTCACLSRPTASGPDSGSGGDANNGDSGTGGPPNVMFVTSSTYDLTNLGGLPGANMKCMTAATNAGLTGTYVAWLSSPTSNAIDTLNGSRGWVRTDGAPFADRVTDIMDGTILYPPVIDESGHPLSADTAVATGTSANGTEATNCFISPSITTGIAGGGTSEWTQGAGIQSCMTALHLYCFQIGHLVPLQPLPMGPKLAFLSSPVSLMAGANITQLDAHCQADALATGLQSHMFQAFAADSSESAAQRFTSPMAARSRLDGVIVTSDLGQFGLITAMDAPLDQTADGQYIDDTPFAGAAGPSVKGLIANDDCSSWSNNTSTTYARLGQSGRIGASAFGQRTNAPCNSPERVYCIEQ